VHEESPAPVYKSLSLNLKSLSLSRKSMTTTVSLSEEIDFNIVYQFNIAN